jgi:hypothetical protein
MGIYMQLARAAIKSTVEEAQNAGKAIRAWKDANSIALLKIRKNCKNGVRARIENLTNAKEAYIALQRGYEGRTPTEVYALFDSLTTFLTCDCS